MVAIVQNLFGLGVGPLITGALSDAFGLQTAMAIVPLSCACAALLLVHRIALLSSRTATRWPTCSSRRSPHAVPVAA